MTSSVHPTAIVMRDVHLGHDVLVHPYAYVGRIPDSSPALARQPEMLGSAVVRMGSVIGPGAVIYRGASIGRDCLIGDYASIREGVIIGDRCVIGRHVTIGYDAVLEDDVHVNDGVHITGGTHVGAGCFFGPGVVTSNDRNIDLRDYGFHGITPPTFGRRVMVGSGANILAGVTIGDDALIGAGAIVVEDVRAGQRILGPKATVKEYSAPRNAAPDASLICDEMRGSGLLFLRSDVPLSDQQALRIREAVRQQIRDGGPVILPQGLSISGPRVDTTPSYDLEHCAA
jgi:acetyltransferase-like isoleucine patch superfamily enzyme